MDSPNRSDNLMMKQEPHSGQTLYAMSGGLLDIIATVSISMVYIMCKKLLLIAMYVTTDHVCNIRQNQGGQNYTFRSEIVGSWRGWKTFR